jgi:hypothetical protein
MANDRLFQFRYSYERDLVDIFVKATEQIPAGSTAPSLGAAASYAALGSSTVTNTGSSVITGNLGLSAGTSVTGFPPGIVIGQQHIADSNAAAAQVSLSAAYIALQAMAPGTAESALGGLTLNAGTYTSASSMSLTGVLTLDGQNNPNAVFVFQMGSTLTTASASSIVLINGAKAANVFFAVGSSATLGTSSTFNGNILAQVSITATTSAVINGRLLARTGAVTLDTNTINIQSNSSLVMSDGKGVISLIRNSAGNYTVNLKSNFFKFMHASAMFRSGAVAPAAPIINIVSAIVNSVSNPAVIIQCRDLSGNPADPADGEELLLQITCRNAST